MVPKQPPPNFQAPTPEISPLRRLFMIIKVYVHFILFFIMRSVSLENKFKHLLKHKCYITL